MQLAASNDGVCGLTTAGAAYCWGPNYTGELGAGLPRKAYTTPQAVVGGHTFTSIVSGPCAIEAVTNKLFCWGEGAPTGVATSPTQYAVGLTFSQISQNGECGITNGATNSTEMSCLLKTTPYVVPGLGLPNGSRVRPATPSDQAARAAPAAALTPASRATR